LGTPFVLGAYITEIFLPKKFGDIGKLGDIGPEILALPVVYKTNRKKKCALFFFIL
jgi:hypothetical protein